MNDHEHNFKFRSSSHSPRIPWAPNADPTMSERVYAACHDKCKECTAELAREAAENTETLAVVLGYSFGLLILPQEAPKFAWLEGRLDPHPPLPTVIARIQRMGSNAIPSTVIGMLRTFSPEDRLGIAAAAMNMIEQFFEQLRLMGPTLFLEEQRRKKHQNPWWIKPNSL